MLDSSSSGKWVLGIAGTVVAVLLGLQVYALRARSVPAPAPKPVPTPSAALSSALRAHAANAPSAPVYGPLRDPAPSSSRPAAAPADDATARELERLAADNAALRARLDDMLAWITENLRGRFPLEEEQMAHLRIPPVDSDGLVSGDLARLLRLTDAETGRLDDAFVGSRDVLYDLESAGITVTIDTAASDAPDGTAPLSATLDFAPYPDDGALVRDALYDELLSTLGRARFARLLQVSGTGLAESFDHFGDRQRTLTVTSLLPAGGDSSPVLLIRDETAVPDPDDPDRQLISAIEAVTPALPAEYARYASLIPPDLASPSSESSP